MVVDDRPTYKDRHARNSSRPGVSISTKGRIHLRRPSSRRLTFPLQSDGGPYIFRQRQIGLASRWQVNLLSVTSLCKEILTRPRSSQGIGTGRVCVRRDCGSKWVIL